MRGGHLIVEVLEQAARAAAEAAAVFDGRTRLSYHGLDRRANQLAHHLRARGVGPEVMVPVCMERRAELVVAFLAILKAGGAYVPIDPLLPRERVAFMLREISPRVIVTEAPLAARFAGGAHVVAFDRDEKLLAAEPATALALPLSAEQLAYLIYTSGSTGKPKGVLVPHRGLPNLIRESISCLRVTRETQFLQFASVSFDASVVETLSALAAGAQLHLASRDQLMPGRPLEELLRERRITAAIFPPSALAAMRPDAVPELKTIMTAGEAAWAELIASWRAGRRITNGYGPTEVTVCATAGEFLEQGRPDIGLPLAETQVYVLDEQGQPAVPLAEGEIYIGGVGLARGYLERPDLTAERFVPDHLSGASGGRLYRTGDRARLLPSGRIDFLGRVDQQVKLRGYRIELGEIEATLLRHPGIREAAVLVREDVPGDRRLVAYLVVQDSSLALTRLYEWLKQWLPQYMIPSGFVPLADMPRTTTGKVDRKALPRPVAARPALADPPVPAANDVERTLIGIWQEALELEPIGTADDFFVLGGRSFLGVRVVATIEERLGVRLSPGWLATATTVAAQAAAIAGLVPGARTPILVRLNERASGRPFFCVHPVTGDVLCYRTLAERLDQPFYGLQSPGLDGDQPPLATVSEMAAEYIESMRQVQSRGPYIIGGWSFGGTVAFEMARQLSARDEKNVASLILIDTRAPEKQVWGGRAGRSEELPAYLFVRNLWRSAGLDFTVARSEFAVDEKERRRLMHAHLAHLMPGSAVDRMFRVCRANLTALWAYDDEAEYRHSGPMTVLETETVHPDCEWPPGSGLGWADYAVTPPRVLTVPGDHYRAVFSPFVEGLAAVLGRCLEESV